MRLKLAEHLSESANLNKIEWVMFTTNLLQLDVLILIIRIHIADFIVPKNKTIEKYRDRFGWKTEWSIFGSDVQMYVSANWLAKCISKKRPLISLF